MTRGLKKRWLIVGATWGVVLALTALNIYLVGRIQSRRQAMETLQMDIAFLEARQSTIQEIRLQKSRLTHAVKSVDLGFLVVENNLKRLSWDFGLRQLRVETDKNHPVSGVIPISILASGPVAAVVGWMAAVEKAYPYLVIERMELICDPAARTGQLQATFNYRFTLAEPGRVG